MARYTRNQAQLSPRQLQESRYNGARVNLLIVIVFTLINLILLVTNAGRYMLFSIFIPYLLATTGMEMCGMLPVEYYDAYYEGGYAAQEFFAPSVFYVLLAISLVIVAVYVLAWLFSKKQRGGWMIAALVLFSLDTLAMVFLGGITTDMLIDYFIHAWVIYELAVGVHAWYRLQTMPEGEAVPVEPAGEPAPGFGKTHEYTGLYKEIYEAYQQGSMMARLSEMAEVLQLDGKSNIDSLDIVVRRNEQEIAFGIDEQSVTMFVSRGTSSKNPEETVLLSELYDIEDLYARMATYIRHNS